MAIKQGQRVKVEGFGEGVFQGVIDEGRHKGRVLIDLDNDPQNHEILDGKPVPRMPFKPVPGCRFSLKDVKPA